MKIPWSKSKRKLALLWFIGSGIIFMVLLLQSILGRYGNESSKAWSWFLPTILPTLSLIISVIVSDELKNSENSLSQNVDKFYFNLSYSLSFSYLFVVFSTILISPFASRSIFELMQDSNMWLGPFQGLVSASLGAIFIKKE
jgi:hypothetical protein